MATHTPARCELPVTCSDGAVLHAEVHGRPDDAPIVLVHGYLSGSQAWRHQVAGLAGRHRVIVYDQRGHGRSRVRDRRFSLDRLGDDLETVLGATLRPDERAVIAGHSLGGVTVTTWARRHTDSFTRRVAGIALFNTTAADPSTFLPASAVFRGALRIAAGLPIGESVGRRIRPRLIGAMTARGTPVEDGEVIYRTFMDTPARCRGGWTRMLLRDLKATTAGALTAPTLVVDSRYDRFLGPAHGAALADTAPELFGYTTLDCGHYSILERPAEVCAALRDLGQQFL